MKSLVVYSSQTGNTKQVAEAIFDVMPRGTVIFPVDNAPSPEEYDFIVLGFWVDKEHADKKSRIYMGQVKGKKVALFATLGAEPDSTHAKKTMVKAKKLLDDDNQIVGEFICRGKIDPKLTRRFMEQSSKNPHPMTEERMALHQSSSKHPSMEDLQNAQETFKKIIKVVGD